MTATALATAAQADSHPLSPQDGVHSLLRMAVGSDVLSVPIADVREILQVTRLTPLPRTPAFVRGVMNLRGSVVPVIDLSVRLHGPATQIGRRSCIVVVESRGAVTDADADDPDASDALVVVGLLVDAVYEVFDTTPGEIEPVPALGTSVDGSYLQGMTRTRGEVIGILALERVLAHRELSSLISRHQPH
jgi:purine-binding chemotaxis protein CheW